MTNIAPLLDPMRPETWLVLGIFISMIGIMMYLAYLAYNEGYGRKAQPIECPYCNQLAKPVTSFHATGKKIFKGRAITYRCRNFYCRMNSFDLREVEQDG